MFAYRVRPRGFPRESTRVYNRRVGWSRLFLDNANGVGQIVVLSDTGRYRGRNYSSHFPIDILDRRPNFQDERVIGRALRYQSQLRKDRQCD
uniref:Uncharacterized protein n=1 Tax=Diadromus pulchellus ascovirus 4a TaxID=158683 RepID=Q9DSV3_9VIRU|nr:hypothetical protein [Diadromus pulchellus ascovirus 4a]